MPVNRCLLEAPLADISRAVGEAMGSFPAQVRGRKVAVAVGSRGIHQLSTVVRAVVARLRAAGAFPIIVPAMGSHGGGTAQGQRGILRHLGVTQDSVGAPLDCAQETVEVLPGVPFSRAALGAGSIVAVNRVKAHTNLEGDWGSGLRKMMVVGLGLAEGARTAHAGGLREALNLHFPALRQAVPLGLGIAVVEDGAAHLARVEGVSPAEFGKVDRELLALARQYVPQLPLPCLDALIFLQMGKDISGAGLDPEVIGRHRRRGEPGGPRSPWVGVLALSPGSGGNAIGVGMVDGVTRRLAESMDVDVTAANAAASGWVEGARLPPVFSHDLDLLLASRDRVARPPRTLLFRDTNHLGRFLASEALAGEIRDHPDLRVDGPLAPLPLDHQGRLDLDSLPL
jgi:hypothetical protein